MGALKIGLNRIKTWLKAKTGKKKSVRAKAGERRNSSFHFNPWARQSNLIFSVISAAPNASWELCRLCSVLVSMPREINHRPEAAGVTHISPLLPLAWHQAAGAPPQSREQWSSHAFCKILAGTHLMRCTVISIFYSALWNWTQHREVWGFFFLCTFSQEFTANYFTHGWGGRTGTKHLPILLPLEKPLHTWLFTFRLFVGSNHHYAVPTTIQKIPAGYQEPDVSTAQQPAGQCMCRTLSLTLAVYSGMGHCDKCSFCLINENLFTVLWWFVLQTLEQCSQCHW